MKVVSEASEEIAATVRSNYALAASIWSDFDFQMLDGECPEFGRTRAVQNCVSYSHSLNLWNLFSSAAVIGYEDHNNGIRVNTRKTIINEVNLTSCKEVPNGEKAASIDERLLQQKSTETRSPSLSGLFSEPIVDWHNPLPLLNCLLCANALVDNDTWSLTAIAPLQDFVDVNYRRTNGEPLVRAELIEQTFDTKFIAITLEEYCLLAKKFRESDGRTHQDRRIHQNNGARQNNRTSQDHRTHQDKSDNQNSKLRSPSNFQFEEYRNHVVIPVLNEMLSDASIVPYIMLQVCNIVQDAIRLRANLQNAASQTDLGYEAECVPYACLTRTPKSRRAIVVTVKDLSTGLYSENGHRLRCLGFNTATNQYEPYWKSISDSKWIYEFDLNHETQAYLRSHFDGQGRCLGMRDKDHIFQLLKAFTAGPGVFEQAMALATECCFRTPMPKQVVNSNPAAKTKASLETFGMVMLTRQENEKENEKVLLTEGRRKFFSYGYDQVNYVRLPNCRRKGASRRFEDLITHQHLLTVSPHCLCASLLRVNDEPARQKQENRVPGHRRRSSSLNRNKSTKASKRRHSSSFPAGPSEKLISLGSIFGYQLSRADNRAVISLFLKLLKFKGTNSSNRIESLENFHLTQSVYAALLHASITQGHTRLGVPLMFGKSPRNVKLAKIIETITRGCITQVNDRNHSYSSFEQIASQSEILFSRRRSEARRLTFVAHYPMEYWLVKGLNQAFGISPDECLDRPRIRRSGKEQFHLIASSAELNSLNESLNYLVSPISYQERSQKLKNKFRWIEKHLQSTKSGKLAPIPISLLAWISNKVKAQFFGDPCPFTSESYTFPLATLALAEISSNKTRRTKCKLPKASPEPIFILELGIDSLADDHLRV